MDIIALNARQPAAARKQHFAAFSRNDLRGQSFRDHLIAATLKQSGRQQ